MTENCMICGKHLSSKLAKTEGVGPECKHGFSRKIRFCSASIIGQEYIDSLFDELEYDIVVTAGKVWWQTDEAPYTHSISTNIWQQPKVEEPACNVTLTAFEELLRMFGYKKIPDVPYPRYVGVSALQNLHRYDREPFWFSIFDAEGLETLIPTEDWFETTHDTIRDELEGMFFPQQWHGSLENLGGLHRMFSIARGIGGNEGSDTLDYVFYYQDEDASLRMHELSECSDAFERGELYWGTLENPYTALYKLVSEMEPAINNRGSLTPLEAEEIVMRVAEDFDSNNVSSGMDELFGNHIPNLIRTLDDWAGRRPDWKGRIKGA